MTSMTPETHRHDESQQVESQRAHSRELAAATDHRERPAGASHDAVPPQSGLLTRAVSLYMKRLGHPPIALVLPNGTQVLTATEPPRVIVHIRNWSTIARLLWQPSLGFGEAYQRGDIDIEGSLLELCEVVDTARYAAGRTRFRGVRGTVRTLNGSRYALQNVHHHYDLGNDFYRLWLDEQLLYTCAYFPTPETDLETAQRAKMDLVCRKVNLQPGQRVIEAGCGWGSLALHMAEHYGVEVTAYNLSHEQIVYARAQARERGLDARVTFVEDDWRQISGECDTFVSVGMLEHVGTKHYRELGDCIHRVLRPAGLGLIHSIGRDVPEPLDDWILRHVFPGAEVPSVRQMADIFEPHRFVMLDLENLRQHYTRTLEHWLERFEENVDTVRDMFDERFVRTWRLYLSGSISTFRTGGLQLYQVVFSRHNNNDIPWSRRIAAGPDSSDRL